MAMNLGSAFRDRAIAPEIVQRAKAVGLGTMLPS